MSSLSISPEGARPDISFVARYHRSPFIAVAVVLHLAPLLLMPASLLRGRPEANLPEAISIAVELVQAEESDASSIEPETGTSTGRETPETEKPIGPALPQKDMQPPAPEMEALKAEPVQPLNVDPQGLAQSDPAPRPERKAAPARARKKQEPSDPPRKVMKKKKKTGQDMAASRSGTEDRDGEARSSVRRGTMADYGAQVLARIERNKPASLGRGGILRISLSLSRTGSLLSARILRSSGDRQLDEAGLTAVRRASLK